MSFQNNKRTKNIFWTIIGLTFICLIINMPQSIPARINIGKFSWQHTFYRPDFKFNIGSFSFKNNLDLKYGLDLSGGASILFDIDTTKTKKEELEIALESLKSNIEQRVNLFGISEANVQLSKENTCKTQGLAALTLSLPQFKSAQPPQSLWSLLNLITKVQSFLRKLPKTFYTKELQFF